MYFEACIYDVLINCFILFRVTILLSVQGLQMQNSLLANSSTDVHLYIIDVHCPCQINLKINN